MFWHVRDRDSTLAEKMLKKTLLDLQKKNPKYHACPKYLAARCCGSAFPENGSAFHQDFEKVGLRLVTWECPLRNWFNILNLSNHSYKWLHFAIPESYLWIQGWYLHLCIFFLQLHLSWRCLWSRWRSEDELDKPATTIGTKFSVLQVIRIPFLMRCWPLILLRISVFIAKLSERQYCWRVFEDFQSQEYVQFFDIHNCLFMRLHFSIGCYDYRRTTRHRQSIHFSRIQVLFAGHVHRRSGIDNKFSFLKFKS